MTSSLCGWRRWAIPGLFLSIVLFPAKLRAQDFTPAQGQSTAPASITAGLFASSRNLLSPPPAFSLRSYRWPSPRPFEGSTNFHLDVPLLQAPALPPQRDVSWRLLPGNILADQKTMWVSFPEHLFLHGQHLLPTLSIISVTGGLIAADPHDAPYFRRTSEYHDFNQAFSEGNTEALLAIAPATAYLVGLWRKDKFAQQTALFSGEAAVDAAAFYLVAQEATRRARPISIPPNGDFGDSFYDGHGLISNSFPSAHAAGAFAIATVFARRYRGHKWVPWVAYGIAGLISFSRVTLQEHFLSDVFMGSAIGYTVGRYVVLQGK